MAIEIFCRKEQKYLISKEQYNRLIEEMGNRMRSDKNGDNGKYTVTSLYFENEAKQIYFETKNKLQYRQKLRLRVYGDTDLAGTAFFEVKQKHKDVVNKRRAVIPLAEAYRYLKEGSKGGLDHFHVSNRQVLKEIDYFINYYGLQPEMIVSYDRHALHGVDDEDLRITFDFNLRCRNQDLHLEHGTYGDPFIDLNLVVLEVKVDHSVPLWLVRILQSLDCEQRSASKFCTSTELLDGELFPLETEFENTTIGGN
ncbi:polyphosphate polymerase domain-containing protein [Planococcus soli]|uniref:polyphosphate polymerase domain-containing protein n=1 Tax=Planococcus soli TaxID=2666072 RepID=UPI00115F6C2D|nr:polyphosphate polymerase domain-containing protein [Planococcus soli]